jgi:three-Cys-motif partner protein
MELERGQKPQVTAPDSSTINHMTDTARRGHVWTADKLEFLKKYLPAFVTACKRARKAGAELHYVDGFAGPGKNNINGIEVDGSPLIALDFDFDKYHFIEEKRKPFTALKTLISGHSKAEQVVTLENADFNAIAATVLKKIPWDSPTFFLLDPEGLELHWNTIQLLARRNKADLFVLVSGSGVTRNWHNPTTLTRFFGSDEWKQLSVNEVVEDLGKDEFGRCIDLYATRLQAAGLPAVEQRLTARLGNNAKLHAFIFAAKKPVANKIATAIIKKMNSGGQSGLF